MQWKTQLVFVRGAFHRHRGAFVLALDLNRQIQLHRQGRASCKFSFNTSSTSSAVRCLAASNKRTETLAGISSFSAISRTRTDCGNLNLAG